MIYLDIPGRAGLGNQMFMLARAISLSKDYKQSIQIISYIDLDKSRRYQLDKFQLGMLDLKSTIRIDRSTSKLEFKIKRKFLSAYSYYIMRKKGTHVVREVANGSVRDYKPLVINASNFYLSGFWENKKYFDKYRELLQQVFSPVGIESNPDYQKYIKIIDSTPNSVGLHVRIGDFAAENKAIKLSYYENAMQYMRKHCDNPVFYLFTIEKNVIEHFAGYDDVVYVHADSPDADFVEWALLKHCKNFIISNSTFSWWPAYLSDNSNTIVCKPSKKVYATVESQTNLDNYDDFYNLEWIEIDY